MEIVNSIVQLLSNCVKQVDWVAITLSVSVATFIAYIIDGNICFLITGIFSFILPMNCHLVKWMKLKKEKRDIIKIGKKVTNEKWQRNLCEKLSLGALLLLKNMKNAKNGKKVNKANRYVLELLHYRCICEVPPTTIENGQCFSYYNLEPWAVNMIAKQETFINELLSKENLK